MDHDDELVITPEMIRKLRQCSCEICEKDADYLEQELATRDLDKLSIDIVG